MTFVGGDGVYTTGTHQHRIAVAAATDVGTRRLQNEDAVLLPGAVMAAAHRSHWSGEVCPGPRSVVAVLDGMGAHGGGATAAALAALTLNELAASEQDVPGVAPDRGWLVESLIKAGDRVVDVGVLDAATRVMGAAIAGVVIGNRQVLVFHVGDCRVYVLDDGYLSLMTTDHRAPSGGLTRSLGGTGRRETVYADVVELDRASARRFLLCTDGVSDTLPFDRIRELLLEPAPLSAALALIAEAVGSGCDDNTTAAIVDVPGAPLQ